MGTLPWTIIWDTSRMNLFLVLATVTITIAEIEAGPCLLTEVTAKEVTMSSVWEGDHWGEYVWLTGDLCIDNNLETKCHTKGDETWPWVAVEIPQSRVKQVNIVNRHDCCGERTKNVKVWVGNTLPNTTDTEYSQGDLLGEFKGPGTNRQVIPLSNSQGLEGKYVIVQMTGTNYINLAEIEVLGVPKWKKVFSHDTAGGLFTDSDWKSKNIGNPSALLYSILDTMEDYRLSDGTFHFKLCYPLLKDGSNGCNEWTQTSTPVVQSDITGYTSININFPLEFKGLGINNIPEYQDGAMIDYKPYHYWWFYPVGAKQYWGGPNTIPGPYLHDYDRNSPVTKVVLFVV